VYPGVVSDWLVCAGGVPDRLACAGVVSDWLVLCLQYRQAYTGHTSSQVQTAMDGFEDVIRRFPTCAEGYALYAQVTPPSVVTC